MAVASYKSRLMLGAYGLTTNLTDITHAPVITMLDSTTLVNTARTFIPGQITSTVAMKGILDTSGAAGAEIDVVNNWTGDSPISFGPSGLAVGAELVSCNALKAQFTPSAQASGIVVFDLQAQADGAVDYGSSLHDLAAETANGASSSATSVDGGAASSNGGCGYLHVTAFSGFSQVVFKVQHSTDNSIFTDLITFTTVTATTSQASVVAGSVNRYVCLSWTKTGTGSVTFTAGFARR